MRLKDKILKIKYLFHILTVGKLHSRPFHCHFQVTRKCNFKCASCCVWKEKAGKHLSIDEIKIAANNLKKIGIKSIVLTGGEPLLRKDILDIVSVFKEKEFIVRLQTNGYFLKKELTEELLLKGLDDIYISFDSLNPKTFLEINGTNNEKNFESVLNNTIETASLTRKYKKVLILTTVIRPSNINEIDKLYNFAKENNCLIGFYGLEVCREGDENNIRSSDKRLIPTKEECEELKNAFIKIKKMKKEKHSPIFIYNKLLNDYIKFYENNANSMMWNCNAGDHYIELLPDGSVGICNATPTLKGYDYKNLIDLYKSPDKNRIFKTYRKKCSGCICTRQLEYLTTDFFDLIEKSIQYIRLIRK